MSNLSIRNLLNTNKSVSGTFFKSCSIKRKWNIKSVPQEAKIYRTLKKDSFERYQMQKDGKLLGEIELENNKDSVFIVNIESYARHKYKGIGANLLAIAIEKSLNKNNSGIVTLNAKPLHKLQKNPKKFYEKMGFVQIPSEHYNILAYGQPMQLITRNNSFWMNKCK